MPTTTTAPPTRPPAVTPNAEPSAGPLPQPANDAGWHPRDHHPSRREFAARATSALVAVSAAVSALGAAGLAACATSPTPAPAGTPTPDPAAKDSAGGPPATPTTAPPADAVTEALFAAVAARYGARLEPEERAHVRDAVGGTVRLSDVLRKRPLPNGVDPFSSFCRPTGGAGAADGTRRGA